METDLYYMRLVVGTGRVEKVVSAQVALPSPAREILEWRKTVLVQRAEALTGSVVLTGRVESRCLYAAAGDPEQVLCRRAEIGFTVRIRVPSAAPGMSVTVVQAHVSGDASRPVCLDEAGLILAVQDVNVLRFRVRVVAPALLPLKARPGPRRPQQPQQPQQPHQPHQSQQPQQPHQPQRPQQSQRPQQPPRPKAKRQPPAPPEPPPSHPLPPPDEAAPPPAPVATDLWVHPSASVPSQNVT